ncbi:uncharacterized protein LOC130692989 [Daphnia carinata]|uniref:uncharacterized protein LOC130692989 n=1 Tax=Daphnia carinata TaxID=120202 RepID=UPI002579EDBF|nr:uncharacterized protein LOC130692989 [Daphnia carinata]
MPLSVAMPCGFEENLMDFECSGGVAGSWGGSSHTVTDFDHPDPLLMVSLSNKEQLNCTNDGIGAIAGSKTDSSSWCRSNSRPSSMSGLAGSGSSSSGGGTNGLSSSSYCRRLGSATTSSSRRSATFQLWSPRLRLRDERKRVLKLSLAKLRRIDDAESCLRRSVLLNNTLRRLQREARDEKTTGVNHQMGPSPDCASRLHHPAVRLEQADNNGHELQMTRSLLSCDELPVSSADLTLETANGQSRAASIKRRRTSADVTDDLSIPSSLESSSCGLNFSDLYLPPTPRMISSLEDEEEAEAWQCVKRPKIAAAGNDVSGRNRPALRPCNSLPSPATSPSTGSSVTSSSSANQNNSPILTGYTSCSGLSLVTSNSSAAASAQQSTYSCGQSSLFGELQSVVFHSLITSLES